MERIINTSLFYLHLLDAIVGIKLDYVNNKHISHAPVNVKPPSVTVYKEIVVSSYIICVCVCRGSIYSYYSTLVYYKECIHTYQDLFDTVSKLYMFTPQTVLINELPCWIENIVI